MIIYYIMAAIFLTGVVMIALEDILKINKAAIAVGMSLILWIITIMEAGGLFSATPPKYLSNFMIGFPEFAALSFQEQICKFLELSITESLGDVATTLFFVLASMAIIEILDAHGSFSVITRFIGTDNKRSLLAIFSFITFFLSALLGNLATVIVMIAVIGKIVPERDDRLIYASMAIIAANAGGSFSPIGDVTTLLLWSGGNLGALNQITHLILPALVMMLVPMSLAMLMFPKGGKITPSQNITAKRLPSYITHRFQRTLLIVGLLSFLLVPFLKSLFEIPPFMGVLLGLVILWIITDIKSRNSTETESANLKVSNLFSHLDLSTIFFFLGILMSVKALSVIGILSILSDGLNALFSNENMIAFLLGICSSFLDNVALVAATMGMYPLAETGAFMADSSFWTFLAYSCVTGGSILIIGSASGVTAMGLEKISFGYYFKRFTPLALLGYLAGAGTYMLIC